MAAYLSLTRFEDDKVFTGKDLIKVDEAICKKLGVIPSKLYWYKGWMDLIGLDLVTGMEWHTILVHYKNDPDLLKVAEFLFANYYNTSYHSR